jgi:endonuclease/exonuclease/phosphatase family metal-dependent hydrolase
LRPGSRQLGLCSLFTLALAAISLAGCVTNASLSAGPSEPAAPGVRWLSPAVSGDQDALARWRLAVGPPVARPRGSPAPAAAAEVIVVSWNIANGSGDAVRFVRTLPPGAPLVLLLQEAYRGGPEVPAALAADARFAGRLGGAEAAPHAQEIESVASALGLNLYYVPSMRNGGRESDEDRGNAILSNLPLTDLLAVELPFERQRRVAIAATVHGTRPGGSPWRLRVASVHLDNMGGIKRAWIGGEYGRTRQARALLQVFGGAEPTVVGGDFNTWFGFSEPAYAETVRAFPDTRVSDARPTFRGLLRLDHLFFRLEPGWRGEFRRAEDRFGSDHFPLIGSLRLD